MKGLHDSNKFRVLVADDENAYLDLFREVLSFDGPMSFELTTCVRADEAVNYVKKSIEQDQPFAVAILDIRMPPGPDGLWAARRIRDMDPHIEIMIITAYLDYAPQEMISNVPPAHKLIYMQKPFQLREIHHFAYALCSKWQHERNWLKIKERMDGLVAERTKDLSVAIEQLKQEAFGHKQTAELLKEAEEGLHLLSANLLNAQEKERKEIAMELHDDFGQILNVLKLNFRYILNKLPKDQDSLKNECVKSIQHVGRLTEKVRRLSHGLTPSTLDDLGLSAALNALIRDFSDYSRIRISCDFEDVDNLFSSMAQLGIYRIFQEALTNIHKHSKAENVSVASKKEKRNISFMIEDNGIGFDMAMVDSNVSGKSSLGLASMKERVRMLDGSIEICSRLLEGTKIVFRIPVKDFGKKM